MTEDLIAGFDRKMNQQMDWLEEYIDSANHWGMRALTEESAEFCHIALRYSNGASVLSKNLVAYSGMRTSHHSLQKLLHHLESQEPVPEDPSRPERYATMHTRLEDLMRKHISATKIIDQSVAELREKELLPEGC